MLFSYSIVLIMILISFLYEPLKEYLAYAVSIFYWLILISLVAGLRSKQLTTKKILRIALILSIIGSLLSIFGVFILTEIIFRLAFVGWVVGIISSIKEYVDNVK